MQFDSLAAAWAMHGYGPFVWSAYAIAAVVLAGIVWTPLARRRRFFARQRHTRQLQARRRAAHTSSPSGRSRAAG